MLPCYTSSMRVLGIDCGTEYTGYGVVDLFSDGSNNDRLVCIVCGAIRVSPRDPMPARLLRISLGLQELISQHRPDRVALEDVFYAVNVNSGLKLGQVRGVAMLAAASAGLEVAEFSPLSIKSAVVGYGRAEKQQVQHRSEEHTSELQSQSNLVCRLLLEKKKLTTYTTTLKYLSLTTKPTK